MGCQSCKEKGKTKLNWMSIVAFEIFIVSIYGHIELFKFLSSLF